MSGTAFFSSSLKSSHFLQMPGLRMATAIRRATACPVLNEPIDTGASGQTEKLRWGAMQPLWKKHWLHLIAWDDGVWTESGVTAAQCVCEGDWKATDRVKEMWEWDWYLHPCAGTPPLHKSKHTCREKRGEWGERVMCCQCVCVCVCESCMSTHC